MKKYKLVVICIVLSMTALSQDIKIKNSLDDNWKWFHKQSKYDGSNYLDRKQHSKIFDSLGFELPASYWNSNQWISDSIKAYQKYPILYYLRNAERNAMEEVRNTKISSGVKIWKFYNMGVIIKTPDKCFSIDFNSIDSEKMVDVLDFAIVSHNHDDHYTQSFLDAMVKSGKKVFSPFYKKGEIVLENKSIVINSLTIDFIRSNQKRVPCLITAIDCGKNSKHFTILHSGDAGPVTDLPKGRVIDLYFVHIWADMNGVEAIKYINPKLANLDHVMEMGHGTGPKEYRWKYQDCYDQIPDSLKAKIVVLTWGESLYFK